MERLTEAAGFRVGDKIRIVNSKDGIMNGREDTIQIIRDMSEDGFYGGNYAFFLKEAGTYFSEVEMEVINPLDNALNRKLYPKRVPEGGYLVRPK